VPLGLSTLYLVIEGKGFDAIPSLLASPMGEEADYFEIVDNASLRLTDASVRSLAGFAQTGFRFTVHSPYQDINIASSDLRRRKASVAAVKESIRNASKFDSLNVVVHPGSSDGSSSIDQSFETNCESLMELWDYSCSLGQRMAVENDILREGGLLVRPTDFRRLFALVGSRLPVLLDVGHANISGTLREFVRTMSSDLAELHIHDNEGVLDQHLGIGRGTTDLGEIGKLFLNTALLFTVESVHDAHESFALLAALRRSAGLA
jgi:sugar phosphate isomerase/epimerase